MKKLIVTLPLSLISITAFAYPGAPEYTGILGNAPIAVMNSQTTQLQAELLGFQTHQTNTPAGNWQVFASGIVNPIRIQNGNLIQPGYHYNAEGFTFGTDYHGQNGLYGFALGRSMGTITYLGGNGSAQMNSNMASAFGGYKWHHLYGTAVATFGILDTSNINHNIGSQNLTGNTTGEQSGFNGTLGYNFVFLHSALRTGPVANINYQNITINGYTETASNAGPLSTLQFAKQDYDYLTSGVGWQINYATQYNTTTLVPYVQATMNHPFSNAQRNIDVGTVVFSPATTSQIPYSPIYSNFVNVNVGVQAIFNTGLDMTFGYNSTLCQNNVNAQSFMVSASMAVM